MTESTVNRLLSRIVQLGIIGPVFSSFLKIIILDKNWGKKYHGVGHE